MITDAIANRISGLKALLLDMDGTLYVGDRAMTGAPAFIAALKAKQIPYLVFTNNSSRAKEVYQQRLAALGMPTAIDQILTSGDASASYISAETTYRRPYVLGTDALKTACRDAGLKPTEAADNPDCVLLGYDTSVTYETLTNACLLVAKGLPYYATHADKTCIDPRGLLPDAGALIAAIETTTSKRPTVLGKPAYAMLGAALRRLGTTPAELAIVGDQLDTDMTMGHDHDVLSCLVLTGETSKERLAKSGVTPDMTVAHIGDFHTILKECGLLSSPLDGS